ncbi:MAG: hypothetical protein ACQEP6_01265, partial [Patescibacteria group bacterium]
MKSYYNNNPEVKAFKVRKRVKYGSSFSFNFKGTGLIFAFFILSLWWASLAFTGSAVIPVQAEVEDGDNMISSLSSAAEETATTETESDDQEEDDISGNDDENEEQGSLLDDLGNEAETTSTDESLDEGKEDINTDDDSDEQGDDTLLDDLEEVAASTTTSDIDENEIDSTNSSGGWFDDFRDRIVDEYFSDDFGADCGGLCASITADPMEVDESGDETTIAWVSNGAKSCEGGNFDTGGETSGTTTENVSEETVFRVTCEDDEGNEKSDSVTVTVKDSDPDPDPIITEFYADPDTIQEGATSTLKWDSNNTDSCTGDKFETESSTSGEYDVSPATTTSYTLTCEGYGETVTATTEVIVEEDKGDRECPDGYQKIVDNMEGSLSWTADDYYDSVILVGGPKDDDENEDPDGRNKEFSDVESGDVLERDNHDISHVCAIEFSGLTPTAEISADPVEVDEGGSTTLEWGSEDADTCNGDGFDTGNATSGTTTVDDITEDSIFKVTCENEEWGTSASDEVEVTVKEVVDPDKGSVRICKMFSDEDGNIITDPDKLPQGDFSIDLYEELDLENKVGSLTLSAEDFDPNASIMAEDEHDAYCKTFNNLEFHSGSIDHNVDGFFYSEEEIDGEDWQEPKYNDQFDVDVEKIDDFFSYSPELFDADDPNNEYDRNKNSDGHISLVNSRPDRTLVLLNTFDEPEEEEYFTINAHKIVCDDASDLPQWHQGDDITKDTAENFTSDSCYCEMNDDWYFEWGIDGEVSAKPGDYVGEAGGEWNTFGPTDENGLATVEIDVDDVASSSRVWVREVLKDGYLPFSDVRDSDNYEPSAEMWCYKDVVNYDNYDFIQDPKAGEEYHCVAFNVEEDQPIIPTVTLDADPTTVEEGGETLLTWDSEDAESCYSNDFETNNATSGTTTVDNITSDTTFTVTCESETGDKESDSVTVDVETTPTPPEPETFTINAHKIVCDDASDLPQWHQGDDITKDTAENFTSDSCYCEMNDDWYFEWGIDGEVSAKPGDYVGEAGGEWNTFGPTDENGLATVEIDVDDVASSSRVWVREVLKDGYLPFSDVRDSDNYEPSAEMWCYKDVVNYDNYDFIQDPKAGEEYHCVAFNVEEDQPIIPTVTLDADPTTVEEGGETLLTWDSEDAESCYSNDFETNNATSGTTTVDNI